MSIVRLPWTDQGYATGSSTGNYAAQVADAGANFVCGLARAYPGAVIGNAASSALQGFWDGLCKNRGGSPPPPNRPTQGGQCVGVDYYWNYSTSANPRVIGANGENAFSVQVGPLTQFKVTGIINEDTIDGVKYVNYAAQHVDGNGTLFIGSAVGFEGDPPVLVTRRVDNLPDECGDGESGYPPETSNPPPGWNQGETVINNNSSIGLTIPLVYAPISANVDVGVNVNVGGVNVRFDLGGVSVNLNPKFQPGEPGYPGNDDKNSDDKIDIIIDNPGSGGGGFNAGDRNTINNTNTAVNNLTNSLNNVSNLVNNVNTKVDNLGDKVDDLSDKIDGIETCCDETSPDSEDDFDREEKTEEDDKKEEGIPKLSFIKIELTKLPEQSKIQWGAGSPDIVFAGWFEWIVAGYALPRQPIHFQRSIFQAPSFADGYAYTLVNGAKGRAIVYKRKVE